MEKVKSLCPNSKRNYLRVTGGPIQISTDKAGGYYKIHLAKKGVRVESNRMVVELTSKQMSDLHNITKLIAG